jgi:DNA mismatch repair ATPase MutL
VNLSPDKRQVYVVHEKELFALVKSSLLSTFESVAAKCPTVPTTPKFTSASTLIGAPSVPENNSVTPIAAPVAQSNKVTPSKLTTTAAAELQKRKSETKQIHGGAQAAKNLKRPNEAATTSSSEPKKQSCLEAFAFGKKRIVESEQSSAPAIAIDVARAEAELQVDTAVVNRRPRSSESPSIPSSSGTLRDVVQRTTVSNLFGLPPGLDMDVKMDEARSSLSRESAMMDSRPNSTASSVGDSMVISPAQVVFHQPPLRLATDTATNNSSSSMTANSIRTKVEILSQVVQQVPLDNASIEPQPSSSAMPTVWF